MTVATTPRGLLRKTRGLHPVLLCFLLGMACALAIYLPFLIVDKGFFLYCGDFNEQQIPFYQYVNRFIKTAGGGTWSWPTDMGSSVVTGYAFYNLGSPFMWLSLWVPSRWMPFAMVPLFMLKFGAIAAAACLYLQRYAKSRGLLVVCSLVYAFCGFNVYNTFFNHMLEPVAIFALLLWALDEYVYGNRRGAFAFLVGLALVDNYFFFIGNVVFLLLYFFVKLAAGEYTISARRFGFLAFEAVLGVGLGMVLALPSLIDLLGNPRTDNFASGFGLLLYGHVQQYFAILSSMFLPPDPPYLPNIFTEGVVKWTSMSAFLPIVGMAGVVAYFRSRKGGAIKWILGICLAMALVPVLNSSFYAFNASYYARWYYMPLLVAVLATLHSLQQPDIDLAGGSRLVLIVTAVYVVFGLVPSNQNGQWSLGVAQEPKKFWLTWLTAMLAAVVFAALVHFVRGRARFAPLLLGAVLAFSVFYSVVHIALGKFPQWERDADYQEMQWQGSAQVQLPSYDEGFYRIDTFEAHDNLGLWLDRSSIRTFNSTVNTSIMEFYPLVGVKRDVSSKPEQEFYGLRGLLAVRYTLMPATEEEAFLSSPGVYGWRYLKHEGPYAIYENENFVPLGFTYDEYISMANLNGVRTEDRSALLMRGIGLDDEQQGRFRRYFSGQAITWEMMEGGEEGAGWYQYDPVNFETYRQDAAARRAAASYETRADAHGFAVKIRLERENLVFFGVPYDEGFAATVNGQPAEVLKVSGGMMAVVAPAGDNEIVFAYRTPGLRTGIIISLVALVVLAGYVGVFYGLKRRGATVAAAPAQAVAGSQAAPGEPCTPGEDEDTVLPTEGAATNAAPPHVDTTPPREE